MILGLDVSTSIVGICILDDNGEFVESSYVDIKKKKEFCQKCLNVSSAFHRIKFNHPIKSIFIEDKLSGFKSGMTSQQTMMKLASFNGALTYMSNQYFDAVPIHIHPSSIKATMKQDGLFIPKGKSKKDLTLSFVRDVVKKFPYEEKRTGRPKDHCYDMADAYITARAGFLRQCKDKESS